jgi:hypothetical protein
VRRLWMLLVVPLLVVPAVGVVAQTPGGYLEGTVTDETTGLPVPGFRLGLEYYDLAGALIGSEPAWTDGFGRYRFGPIPAGSFKLHFFDNELFRYADEWWRDKPDSATADPVIVTDGATTTGIDFNVAPPVPPPGGYVEGRLTVVPDGTPVPAGLGFSIIAVALDGSRAGDAFTVSGADGRFRVGPLPAGSVKLSFADHTWFAYSGAACPCFSPDGLPASYTAWWPNATDFAGASVVEIRIDETIVADFSLRQVGPIPQQVTTTTTAIEVLPFTGGNSAALAVLGLVLLLAGFGFVLAGKPEIARR